MSKNNTKIKEAAVIQKSHTTEPDEETKKSLHRFHIANSIAWIVLACTISVLLILYVISHKQYGMQVIWYYAPTWVPFVLVSFTAIICSEKNLNRLEAKEEG